MALVNVLSKELERDLSMAIRQLTATAKAAEDLLKNLDADRKKLSARMDRVMAAVKEDA